MVKITAGHPGRSLRALLLPADAHRSRHDRCEGYHLDPKRLLSTTALHQHHAECADSFRFGKPAITDSGGALVVMS
jgi:hypothetical protein